AGVLFRLVVARFGFLVLLFVLGTAALGGEEARQVPAARRKLELLHRVDAVLPAWAGQAPAEGTDEVRLEGAEQVRARTGERRHGDPFARLYDGVELLSVPPTR